MRIWWAQLPLIIYVKRIGGEMSTKSKLRLMMSIHPTERATTQWTAIESNHTKPHSVGIIVLIATDGELFTMKSLFTLLLTQ
jgi:hypothetical protein